MLFSEKDKYERPKLKIALYANKDILTESQVVDDNEEDVDLGVLGEPSAPDE